MSRFPEKANPCKQAFSYIEEKRGWVRIVRSQAKERLSENEYKAFMKKLGWKTLIYKSPSKCREALLFL